jgi:hypothetical protein
MARLVFEFRKATAPLGSFLLALQHLLDSRDVQQRLHIYVRYLFILFLNIAVLYFNCVLAATGDRAGESEGGRVVTAQTSELDMIKYLAIFLVCVITVIAGCGGDDDNTGSTHLRILHASPDAPNVDVYVDNGLVLANVPYPTASNYLTIAAGAHNVKINAAGTSTTVISVSPTLVRDGYYTAIAANFIASIQALLATDDASAPPAGQARLRVIHAAPDAGPVDILVNNQVVLSNVPFATISSYLMVPAGTYDIKVNATGTSVTAIEATVVAAAGSNYSAVAIGSLKTAATNPLTLKVLVDGM